MSRYYEMAVTVYNFKTENLDKIQEEMEELWDFGFIDDSDSEGIDSEGTKLFAVGRDNLCGGMTEQEFATTLSHDIWRANGGYCTVEVHATYLEDLPCESYYFDEDAYRKFQEEMKDENP